MIVGSFNTSIMEYNHGRSANFADLDCWRRARQWAKRIFSLTQGEPFHSDLRLLSQINDSADSAMANIAEGFGRGLRENSSHSSVTPSAASTRRNRTSATAYDRGYVARPDFAKEYQEATETRKTVLGLMNSMVQRGSGVKHMRRLKNFTDEVWERYERITGKPRPALFVRPKEDVGGQG